MYRRSFSTFLESKDRGLHYDATVRYRWTINKAAQGPRMLAPDALVRHLLRENLADVAHKYRILNKDVAQNAMNALLGQGMQDDEKRVQIDAYVELRIPKSEKAAAAQRLNEETKLRTAHARETIELDLMLSRLTDPSLGPVWWVTKYADLQFSAGDPEKKMKSILAAFSELRNTLHVAEIDRTTDLQLLVRRKIYEVFSVIQNEQSLLFALEIMNRTLDHMGILGNENSISPNGQEAKGDT